MANEYRFEEHQRVRLRPDVDTTIYGDYACAGNEGIVVKRRKDKFNYPEYLIHWDKNHWTYNGIQDGWAFEEHFEPVEIMSDKKKNKQQQLDSLLQSFGEGLKGILDDNASEPEAEKPAKTEGRGLKNLLEATNESSLADEYEEAMQEAVGHLADAEGFIVLGVTRRDHPGASQGILVPFAMSYAKTMESELLLGAHMASIASRSHQDLAVQAIQAIVAMGDDQDS